MYVRALSPAEQAGVEAGLRSSDAFTLRRSQILLASSREQHPGLRTIVEPTRLLTAQEFRQRVCDYSGCKQAKLLTQKVS